MLLRSRKQPRIAGAIRHTKQTRSSACRSVARSGWRFRSIVLIACRKPQMERAESRCTRFYAHATSAWRLLAAAADVVFLRWSCLRKRRRCMPFAIFAPHLEFVSQVQSGEGFPPRSFPPSISGMVRCRSPPDYISTVREGKMIIGLYAKEVLWRGSNGPLCWTFSRGCTRCALL